MYKLILRKFSYRVNNNYNITDTRAPRHLAWQKKIPKLVLGRKMI